MSATRKTKSESEEMKQILINCCFIASILLTQQAIASVINSNVDQKIVQFDDDRWTDEEYQFIMNIVANQTESRNSKQKQQQQTASTKVPQIPPVTADPVQAVQSRVPCNCTQGICACCMGGFFFNNKGCVKLKYIPEDFAFEVRMMFNDRVLYKNIVSGKNPRPICITPPRFDGFVELCARFHNIYFIGRNMHVCLDINASIADFDLIDR